jgi:hypothetical protein
VFSSFSVVLFFAELTTEREEKEDRLKKSDLVAESDDFNSVG